MGKEFTYFNKPLYELESVLAIKDIDKQLEEIDLRLKKLRRWCLDEGIIMTDLHMRNALRVSHSSWERMIRGTVKETVDGVSRNIKAEQSKKLSNEQKRALRARSDYLIQWHEYCRQWCLDSVAKDAVPSRSIYISKSIFHNWDTPQEKKDNKISVELLVQKAKEKAND